MRSALSLLVCLAATGILLADTPPCTQVHYAGEVILRMRAGACDRTPQQRAVEVNQQLVEAMSVILASHKPFNPGSVVIRRVRHGAPCRHEIWFGDLRLVCVTQADANANGCCTQQLAARWARNIRRALFKATHDC
jgi:hypothetical protein